MKNVSLILNIILFIAVGILFYKVYSEKPAVEVVSSSDKNEAKIVFINSDTLLDNYPLLKKLEKEFAHKRDSVERLLKVKDKNIKEEFAQFEQQAPSMPEEQRQKIYEGFMQKQQQLEQFRDDLLKHLADEQTQMQDSVHHSLVNFLKIYNRSHGYDYIMSFQRGNGILLANDSLEITGEVLKGLKE